MTILGVGWAEALLVMVLFVVLFGPARVPEVMREAGRWYRYARRFSAEVMRDVRAAAATLEADARADIEQFRSVREMSEELAEELQETRRALQREAAATDAALRSPVPGADEAGDERPAQPTSTSSASPPRSPSADQPRPRRRAQ